MFPTSHLTLPCPFRVKPFPFVLSVCTRAGTLGLPGDTHGPRSPGATTAPGVPSVATRVPAPSEPQATPMSPPPAPPPPVRPAALGPGAAAPGPGRAMAPHPPSAGQYLRSDSGGSDTPMLPEGPAPGAAPGECPGAGPGPDGGPGAARGQRQRRCGPLWGSVAIMAILALQIASTTGLFVYFTMAISKVSFAPAVGVRPRESRRGGRALPAPGPRLCPLGTERPAPPRRGSRYGLRGNAVPSSPGSSDPDVD